jgi:hypothetical protein
VEAWLAAQDISALFLSVVSIGELESGFITMVDAARRTLRFNAAERRLMQVLRFLPKNDDPPVRPVSGGRLGRLLQGQQRPSWPRDKPHRIYLSGLRFKMNIDQ